MAVTVTVWLGLGAAVDCCWEWDGDICKSRRNGKIPKHRESQWGLKRAECLRWYRVDEVKAKGSIGNGRDLLLFEGIVPASFGLLLLNTQNVPFPIRCCVLELLLAITLLHHYLFTLNKLVIKVTLPVF